MLTQVKYGDVVVRVARGGKPLTFSDELEVKVVDRLAEVRVKLDHPVPHQPLVDGWSGVPIDHEYGHVGWSGDPFATASGVLFQDGTSGLIEDFALALNHFHATREMVAKATKRNRALYDKILNELGRKVERQSA